MRNISIIISDNESLVFHISQITDSTYTSYILSFELCPCFSFSLLNRNDQFLFNFDEHMHYVNPIEQLSRMAKCLLF